MDENPLAVSCDHAVRVLDEAMGPRMSGAIISGSIIPCFRGDESIQVLTQRAFVHPLMDVLGYGAPMHGLDHLNHFDGTVLAFVPANHPLDDPIDQILMFMRGRGILRGIATNGIQWVLSESDRSRTLKVFTIDLRPFYVEALDRSRFKSDVRVDVRVAHEFVRVFSRPSSVSE